MEKWRGRGCLGVAGPGLRGQKGQGWEGNREGEDFSGVVFIFQTMFFRNMGKDGNSYVDSTSSKTTPFWTEPKACDQHVIRTQEVTKMKMN